MKEIKAIIQPFMLGKVVEGLREIEGLPGLTVSEVRGFGKREAVDGSGKVIDSYVDFTPKAKLEIVVSDELAERVVRLIQEHAHTGNPGDGKVFICDVQEVVKVRTGERGDAAI